MLREEELSELESLGISLTNADVQAVLNLSYVKLFPFQKEGVLGLLRRGAKSCLFDESGLGKSVQALVTVFLRCFSENCFKANEVVVIVCPPMLKVNWWTLIEEWMPLMDIDDVFMYVSKKGPLLSCKNGNKRKIIIISTAAVDVLYDCPGLKIHTLVIDESHLTKNFLSKRTLTIASLRAKYSILLSGSPIQKKPVDLMAQVALSLSFSEIRSLDEDSPFAEQTDILKNLFEMKNFYFVQKFFMKNKNIFRNQMRLWKTDVNIIEPKLRKVDLARLNDSLILFVDFLASCFDVMKVVGHCKHYFFVEIKRKYFSLTSNAQSSFEHLTSFVKSMRQFRVKYCKELEKTKPMLKFLFCCHQMLSIHSGFTVRKVRGKRASKMLIDYGSSFSNVFTWFFKSRCIRRLRSEVKMDMPLKMVKIFNVCPEVTTCKEYNAMDSSKDVSVNCSTAELKDLSKMIDLSLHEIGVELKNIAMKKISACVDYISNVCSVIDAKCVVFAKHIEFIDALLISLSEKIPSANVLCVTGKTLPNERMQIIKRFDSSKSSKVLILSIGANNVGFSLNSVSHVVFCELLWCAGEMQQAEDRAIRLGQLNEKVYVTYLIYRQTLEEMLLVILQKRRKVIEHVWNKLHTTIDNNVHAHKLDNSGQFFPRKNLFTWSQKKIGFRMNIFTNRVHLYEKSSETASWEHCFKTFAFENCLQLCTFLPKHQKSLVSSLHAFAIEWTQLSAKAKKELNDHEEPLELPLRLNLIGSNRKSVKDRFDAINSFERYTHPDLQMHASASMRVSPGKYSVKSVELWSKEVIHVAENIAKNCFMCKYCGQDLKSSVFKEVHLEMLFCQEKQRNCYLKFLLKCCVKRARVVLRDIDHGVCRSCNVDTLSLLRKCLKLAPGSGLRIAAMTCPLLHANGRCSHTSLNGFNDLVKEHWTLPQIEELSVTKKESIEKAKHLREGHFWEADHILAVKLGGLSIEENFQTLCIICHSKKTITDRKKISLFKRAETETLP